MVQVLREQGVIDGVAWTEAFGAGLKEADADGAPDTEATYYQVLAETLALFLPDAGVLSVSDIDTRTQDWRRAYETTPHGAPVVLASADVAKSAKPNGDVG